MKHLALYSFFILIAISSICYAEKETLVVVDLKAIKIDDGASYLLSDRLRTTITKLNLYTVLSREEMDNIVKEINFQRTEACDDTNCYVELGGALGAKKMVAGTIGKIGEAFTLSLKLIDIKQAKNEQTASADCQGDMSQLLKVIDRTVHDLFKVPYNENNYQFNSNLTAKNSQNIFLPEWKSLGISKYELKELKGLGYNVNEWKNSGLDVSEFIEFKLSNYNTIREFTVMKKYNMGKSYKNTGIYLTVGGLAMLSAGAYGLISFIDSLQCEDECETTDTECTDECSLGGSFIFPMLLGIFGTAAGISMTVPGMVFWSNGSDLMEKWDPKKLSKPGLSLNYIYKRKTDAHILTYKTYF